MNFNLLIPELSVSHFEKSLSFYIEVLKFRVEFQRPEHHREFLVMDPDGYLLRFAQSLGERLQREAGES